MSQPMGSISSGVGSGVGVGVGAGSGVGVGVGVGRGGLGGWTRLLIHSNTRLAASRSASTGGRSPRQWLKPQLAPPTNPRTTMENRICRIRRWRFQAFSFLFGAGLADGGGSICGGAGGSGSSGAGATGSVAGTMKLPPHRGHATSCPAQASSISRSWWQCGHARRIN